MTPVRSGERRSALWPFLVMPLIVLVVFYLLYKVHQRPGNAPADEAARAPPPAARQGTGQ